MITQTTASTNHVCEIVLVQGSHDANGFPCGRPSNDACCDCGSELCDLHTEACDLCGQIFCSMCFWLHLKQSEGKPARTASLPQRIRRRA